MVGLYDGFKYTLFMDFPSFFFFLLLSYGKYCLILFSSGICNILVTVLFLYVIVCVCVCVCSSSGSSSSKS